LRAAATGDGVDNGAAPVYEDDVDNGVTQHPIIIYYYDVYMPIITMCIGRRRHGKTSEHKSAQHSWTQNDTCLPQNPMTPREQT